MNKNKYPDAFLEEKRYSYLVGRILINIGHVTFFGSLLGYLYIYTFGNPNAGISGVPLALSLLPYWAGYDHIQTTYKRWLKKSEGGN